ncbi:hypothetical protein [Microbacterium sp. GCS4]|uniref:hypothetical protein n=1 Tax=Microbacterium sp. GCS4 TaxID=1692239 RepID=UPI001F37EB60|nr:hypothetical protein [Microbacterium sp. GCS4]
MFVSAEIVAVVLSAIGIVLTLGTSMFLGFAWCVRRTDAVEERVSTRIDNLAHEVTELKIAVARLEGPVPHLLTRPR